ncbi:ribosomal protection-like ABC-F family protein [Oceanirhabdus sp. W0125-5]|uniref:ribosomal protection-like ABC-F family protein n=1 Tax=Oceanirhabdus sp. W0125-5 TaxID=2999116 RepID=UPI0022F3378F|nr:ABC-F family ATP-binding cassette domain-containing protein [Oceanirhabdus sp. W0125-5]WBW97755.1 ABC-F family ATP-binding cassette domain-containing protein [Oceanirhabdus sp. W0125-5]
MIDISIKDMEKYYGATRVLENISFDVKSGEKVGVVGLNGSGKTTLLKVICGIEEYESGIMAVRKGATIGYLDQLPEHLDNYKIIDILYSAFDHVLDIKKKMVYVENQMKKLNGEALEIILKEYGELQECFEHMGGYDIEKNIKRVCIGLKINKEFQNRKFNTLSGGEKTTVLLAKILLQRSDILLLDEPSNHLDMESIEWLEGFLKAYEGSVILISHDRHFMDKVIDKTVEIYKGVSSIYNGNYSYYARERKNRYRQQLKLHTIQQKKIRKIKNDIVRLRVWESRGGSGKFYIKAFSLQKRLDKIKRIEKPVIDHRKIKLGFSINNRSEKEVLEVRGLTKSFENKRLFTDLNLKVMYGEKVAIVGKNGIGKSTLAQIIMNKCKADEGNVKIGEEVKIGYLAQNITFSDKEQTVLEAFREELDITYQEARSALAKFLFTKDDVFKKVSTLSGGERSRLRLCKFMQQDINLLILDEPTNHFDINSREMLEKSLKHFDGTMICISHDRYFIDKVAERVVELTDNGIIERKILNI